MESVLVGMFRSVLVFGLLGLAGCVSEPQVPLENPSSEPVAIPLPEPKVFEWSGRVIASQLDGPSHIRPTEDVLFPVQQEGLLFELKEVPQIMQVSLAWDGPADSQFLIMLHSHKAHGTNAYVEHITKMSKERPQCLQVPAADFTTGEWQIMVHTRQAVNVEFDLKVTLVGGAGAWVMDDRHGHWLQDGSFEVDEHEIEPCGPVA